MNPSVDVSARASHEGVRRHVERRLPHLRNRYLLALDACLLPFAGWLAFTIRFESTAWPAGATSLFVVFVALVLPLKIVLMWRLRLYSRLWRYASVGDLGYLATAFVGAAIASIVVGLGVVPFLGLAFARVPLAAVALDALLSAAMVAAPRLFVSVAARWTPTVQPGSGRRVLLVGAGAAGSMIARELLDNPQLGLTPVGFLDDDPSKRNRRLLGIEILGTVGELAELVRRFAIEEVIIAMPSVSGQVVRQIVRTASETGISTRTVPGLFELLDGRKAVSALRKVEIEDLLRREPVDTDLILVRSLAEERTVLVTGAGGSIGAELCRQIARLAPSRLVAVGRGENSIFELLQQMHASHPNLVIEPVIADVRDAVRMEAIFRSTRPSTVFHAAAHKHVPLMEMQIAEAVLNNVAGTQIVGEMAARFGAERFVLISSDKAVKPSSVMGATKRLAEGVVQRLNERYDCSFMSVRFGNVLGSRGSVVPTFLRQIHAGGPITITHPEMRRYFMTIPEAVQLVLQAGAMGEGGEVFVLDMGEPVRVYDLARDLVRLSGLEEGRDIEIQITGMRPGEKLYEELFFGAENSTKTRHSKILRARNAALDSRPSLSLDDLVAMARRNEPADELKRAIGLLVPEYTGLRDAAPPPAEVERPSGMLAPVG